MVNRLYFQWGDHVVSENYSKRLLLERKINISERKINKHQVKFDEWRQLKVININRRGSTLIDEFIKYFSLYKKNTEKMSDTEDSFELDDRKAEIVPALHKNEGN